MADPDFDQHAITNVILYDKDGIAFAVQDGVAIPANTPRMLVAGDNSGGFAQTLRTDASRRLQVSQVPPDPPPGTSSIEIVAQSIVTTVVDTDFTITDLKKLIINRFFGGGETNAKQSKFELYHSIDAGATDGTLLAFGYIGNENNFSVDLNLEFTGSGTDEVIRMRRERLDGSGRELSAAWLGFIET